MIPIQIIGIGQGKKDLTPAQLDLIYDCDILAGGKRLLAIFKDASAQTIVIEKNIKSLILTLARKAKTSKIVVLASGDPLFYGIGSTFCKWLDRDKFEIHANVSSIAAAFAILKLAWQDARVISLHGSTGKKFPWADVARENKIAFLTDPDRNPHYIAKQLITGKLTGFRLCVLECLGDPEKQKITWHDRLEYVANQKFEHPNIVILLKNDSTVSTKDEHRHLGMADENFRHRDGLITKSEVRSITLAKLKLHRPDHILWDIGAGSGSVGIEASFFIPDGKVYAIEKNESRVPDIRKNAGRFKCFNHHCIHANFPEGICNLEKPDRIFIGGGGSDLDLILKQAFEQLKNCGVLVVNTVLLQSLNQAVAILENLGLKTDVVQIQVSRGRSMPFGTRLEAMNPVWIISGQKLKREK